MECETHHKWWATGPSPREGAYAHKVKPTQRVGHRIFISHIKRLGKFEDKPAPQGFLVSTQTYIFPHAVR
jgi:hypothetical protein